MKSIYAYTEEIDNISLAAEHLSNQINQKGPLLKNTVGIVMADAQVNIPELSRRLNKQFSFPVIGCTTLAMLNKREGYTDTCITMTVLTAEDCEFHCGITEEIRCSADMNHVDKLYQDIREDMQDKEKLIFVLSPMLKEAVGDNIVEHLDKLCNKTPIFGGFACDDWEFTDTSIFLNDRVSSSSVVMMLISGNIKPLIQREHSISSVTGMKLNVTKSVGPVVYHVNKHTMKETLHEIGMLSGQSEDVTVFHNMPYLSTMKTEDGDEIDVLRGLVFYNHKDESATFYGDVKEGSELQMCLINKEAVETSVNQAFSRLFEQIRQEKEYHYSTIICISCIDRYSLIIADKQIEARGYQGRIPDDMELTGFYSYGEFCPVRGKHHGRYHNAFNNETIIIMAI